MLGYLDGEESSPTGDRTHRDCTEMFKLERTPDKRALNPIFAFGVRRMRAALGHQVATSGMRGTKLTGQW